MALEALCSYEVGFTVSYTEEVAYLNKCPRVPPRSSPEQDAVDHAERRVKQNR